MAGDAAILEDELVDPGAPTYSMEKIAEIAHEVNRGLCLALGDKSQPRWSKAEKWQKDSARAGVVSIVTHEVTSPADSHIAWFTHKLHDGWKYGPVKDPEKKEHPCMVAFEKLPADQQLKDYLFFNVVTVLAFR